MNIRRWREDRDLEWVTRQRARELRHSVTAPENLLWLYLRNGRKKGVAFRRQHPLAPFIVDFFCSAARLVVEVDGESHAHSILRDAARTLELESRGLKVIRVSDDEVISGAADLSEWIVGQAVARARELGNL